LLGGVIRSLPGQKKHAEGVASAGLGLTKSVGLLARSVAMITHRSVK
jgi:hypothetical protein